MNNVPNHYHNGTDANKLDAKEALNGCPQTLIIPVVGTAGGTYTAGVQAIINAQTAAINDIITKLKAIGITL